MTMDNLSLRDLFASMEYNKKQLSDAVGRLEKEAQTIQGHYEARKAAQGRIATAQREIGSLKGSKSDLFGQWQQAEFDEDQEARKKLKAERKDMDARIAELEGDIEAERIFLDTQTVDKTHAAEVAARRDTLKKLNVGDFIERLKALLEEDVKDLNNRIDGIAIDSSMFNRDEYERIRSGRDLSYAMQQSQHRRLAVKEEEKRKKMNPISNTSDMADHMGSRRKPEDRLNVTSKGQKVKTYSERKAPVDEEADRTHVLSGEEVRAALASKQK